MIINPHSHAISSVATRIADSLQHHGVEVWQQEVNRYEIDLSLLKSTDMVIAVGGDGVILRAARVCAMHQIPILGVNMGYLGFLTEVGSPHDWDTVLDQLLKRKYWLEKRMTLHVEVTRDNRHLGSGDALNDVVINHEGGFGTVLLQAYIDHYWTTTYHVDALIIATATGSTGYAIAAGGPILPPDLSNILIVPVAPHLSMDRSIVLSEGSSVQVVVAPERQRGAVVVVDGIELCNIQPHDCVSIQSVTIVRILSACGNTTTSIGRF